jgi:hypothetical protein
MPRKFNALLDESSSSSLFRSDDRFPASAILLAWRHFSTYDRVHASSSIVHGVLSDEFRIIDRDIIINEKKNVTRGTNNCLVSGAHNPRSRNTEMKDIWMQANDLLQFHRGLTAVLIGNKNLKIVIVGIEKLREGRKQILVSSIRWYYY